MAQTSGPGPAKVSGPWVGKGINAMGEIHISRARSPVEPPSRSVIPAGSGSHLAWGARPARMGIQEGGHRTASAAWDRVAGCWDRLAASFCGPSSRPGDARQCRTGIRNGRGRPATWNPDGVARRSAGSRGILLTACSKFAAGSRKCRADSRTSGRTLSVARRAYRAGADTGAAYLPFSASAGMRAVYVRFATRYAALWS